MNRRATAFRTFIAIIALLAHFTQGASAVLCQFVPDMEMAPTHTGMPDHDQGGESKPTHDSQMPECPLMLAAGGSCGLASLPGRFPTSDACGHEFEPGIATEDNVVPVLFITSTFRPPRS